jgi:hypothetical protein
MKKTQEELNRELLEAARIDDFEEAKKLIAYGANVNTVHITGSTPLLLFGWGHKALQAVPYLLKRGANAQAKYNSETLLEWAERKRQTTLAAILREHIAKLEEKPENPLRFKTEAEFVKEFGKDWRHTGDKEWNNDGVMDYLFGLPCKPEWVGSFQTMHPSKCPHGVPRWYVEAWMVTTEPLPQEQPEDVTQEAPVTKENFLYACYKGDTEVVAKYIEQGGDVNVRGSLGYVTGLHEAAQGNRVAVAKMLIAAGADVTTQNGMGNPALDIAQAYNHKVIVDLILAEIMKKSAPDSPAVAGVYPTSAVVDPDPDVDSPAHYNQGGIECIEAIRAALTEEEFRGYLKGNALKYIWRERHKGNSEQDIKKAIWYLSKLID